MGKWAKKKEKAKTESHPQQESSVVDDLLEPPCDGGMQSRELSSEPMKSSEKHLVGHPQLHRILCRFIHHIDLLDLRLVSLPACYETDSFVADTTADFVLNGTESPISASRNACLLFVPLKVSRENDWFRREIEPILATGWAETEQIVAERNAQFTPSYRDAVHEAQSKLRRDQQRVIWGRIGWILHHALGSKGRLLHIRRWGGAEKVDALTCYSRALTLGAGDVESWCGLHEMGWSRSTNGKDGTLLMHPILRDIKSFLIPSFISNIPGWQQEVRLCQVAAEHQAIGNNAMLLRSMLERFPNNATVWAMNGYYRHLDTRSARKDVGWDFFKLAILLDSRDYLIWLRLARLLKERGECSIQLRLSQYSSEEITFTAADCLHRAMELNSHLNHDDEWRTIIAPRRLVSILFHDVITDPNAKGKVCRRH